MIRALKIAAIFAIGFVVGWLGMYIVYPDLHGADKKDYHRYQGHLDGMNHAKEAIRKEFGPYRRDEPTSYTMVFGSKASSVVAVEVDGVKTVRVME